MTSRERVESFCEAADIPGYVVGVWRDGAESVVSHGTANVATGAPMRDDTGFLVGSVAKLFTTTLVLQQVERGALDLDAPVCRYVPEFDLAPPGAAERITVRHLLTHTNGIDADLFFPPGSGPGALRSYVDGLRRKGALFGAGEHVSYANGGMIMAGRVLEAVTGRSYHDLLAADLYGPAAMRDSSTSAAEAILRSTAVGHFPTAGDPPHDADRPQVGGVRPTELFMLPDTWGPAGGTPISTVGDLLAFGRLLKDGGPALSAEWAQRMRSVQVPSVTPNVPPMGLGWLLVPFGDTVVLSHSGASPGGVALLAVVPERDLVFAAFGNSAAAMALHEELLLSVLGIGAPELLTAPCPVQDLTRFAGTYRSDQLRVEVRVVDGELEEHLTYEPEDGAQEDIFTRFVGGPFAVPPLRYVPVGAGLFAPKGVPVEAFNGYSRQQLVSYHGELRCAGGRMSRRVDT